MRTRIWGAALLGRTFVGPVFDYLLIGGGLSLVVSVAVLKFPRIEGGLITAATLAYITLFCNSAHFAASTVRLYTKQGTY